MIIYLTNPIFSDKLRDLVIPLKIILILQLFLVFGTVGWSQKINLKINGNLKEGYTVDLYSGKKLLVRNTEEFSVDFANLDLSERATISHWKGSRWTGDANMITLTGNAFIPEFDLHLSIQVTYNVINQQVVKKTVDLSQAGMPCLYYLLQETSKPAEPPLKYVTFEQDDFPGGWAHEMYPSAGFVTAEKQLVGFLMDAGYKNHYTRSTRRRFNGHGGGFVGMRRLPDPALVSVATPEERTKKQDYIRQTFGEMYNLDTGSVKKLILDHPFSQIGEVEFEEKDGMMTLLCKNPDKSGIEILTPMKDQKVYTVSFDAKGTIPIALKLFRVKNGKKTIELEHGIKYIDHFPLKENEWTRFTGSILVPYIEQDKVTLFLGSQSGQAGKIQLKDLQILEHQPQIQPYNKMKMGEKITKTTFIFVEPWKDHHDFMISSKLRFAEGKGFCGSIIEKMVYANFNSLTWITSIDDFTPFNVPNMNYAPDMYNRDSFFSVISSYNRELNLQICDQWGKTQTSAGAIGTIITPYMGSSEVKDNEATILWLIWVMMNKRRFGVTPEKSKIDKAVEYVLKEFDKDQQGICRAAFSLSQIDIVDYHPKTDCLAVNQGMFAIVLRTIKELGYEVSEDYIEKAEKGYRSFYDVKRKHLLFDRNFPDIISLTDLEPEFFSFWLFDRPLLTDQMVINHLNQYPVLNQVANSPHPEIGTTAPLCVRLTKGGYSYFSSDYQPFGEFGKSNYKTGARDGFYYNGGSWMRAEYCAYVAGFKHGWKKARIHMENRAWAEINLNPKWPFSKEFIPTKWTTTDSWWPSTRGLCWNVFLLMADEVAGLRTPDMDPDYQP